MAITRSTTSVDLLDVPRAESLGLLNQLPTIKDVLQRLYFFLKKEKCDLSSSSILVIEEVFQVWTKASIPTIEKRNAIQKIKTEYEKHRKALKNSSRRGAVQKQREADYKKYSLGLFDMAKGDVMSVIKIQEDRDFLLDQRSTRKLFIGGTDKEFEAKCKNKAKKLEDFERRCQKSREDINRLMQTAAGDEVHSSSSKASSSEDDTVDDNYEPPLKPQRSRSPLYPPASVNRRRRVIDDPLFVASCDRAGVSTRAAMHVVTPALMAAGVNVGELTLSIGSLHEARKEARTELAQSLQDKFQPKVPLILHFDGKLLPDPEGSRSDRLAIVVTGIALEKILAIPSIPAGTGEAMGGAILKVLDEWPLVKPWVAGLSFDTTAANTGVHSGACAVIERSLGTRLLFLACRHHTAELMMSAVFDHFFSSSGPDIPLFCRFKDFWDRIDQSSFDSYDDLNQNSRQWLDNRANDIEQFVLRHMEKAQPRDDYYQLLNLTMVYLGKKPPKMTFRRPGAYHRARWMAKGLYCIQIYLFRRQLKEASNFAFTRHQEEAIKRVCVFLVSIYVRHWFEAPRAVDAPINDLLLLKEIEAYKLVDADVAKKAMDKVKGHLWYLSEDLAPLAMFSKKVSLEEKTQMLQNIKAASSTKSDLRRVDMKTSTVADLKISQFVTRRSQNLFSRLKMDIPRTLEDLETVPEVLAELKVVNDAAERAVKLATDYNMALTTSEEERQFVFRVVQFHRQQYKASKKSFLDN